MSKGHVYFGCEQMNGLFTPFIQITMHSGKVITLTADCGVETIEDGKSLCEFLFSVLANPVGDIERYEDGKGMKQ